MWVGEQTHQDPGTDSYPWYTGSHGSRENRASVRNKLCIYHKGVGEGKGEWNRGVYLRGEYRDSLPYTSGYLMATYSCSYL